MARQVRVVKPDATKVERAGADGMRDRRGGLSWVGPGCIGGMGWAGGGDGRAEELESECEKR